MYFKVAKNTPRIHAGKEVKPYTVLKWTGIAINTFFPLCELVTWIAMNYTVFVSQSDKLWTIKANVASFFAVYVTWMVSGGILVWAVFSIRNYVNSAQTNSMINIKTMILHSSAFILFLLSVVVMVVFYGLLLKALVA